jgi:hypothetical protein
MINNFTGIHFKKWIVGIVDGDGSFSKNLENQEGTRFSFVVSQHKSSANILYALKKFFQCGNVSRVDREMMEFRVTRQDHLKNLIFPFFSLYSPQGAKKKRDLLRVKSELKQYLLKPRLRKRTNIPYNGPTLASLGIGPPVHTELYKSPDWLAGFIDAEGCFYVSMTGNRPRPQFILVSALEEIDLFEKIKSHYGIGSVRIRRAKTKPSYALFQVNNNQDLAILFQLLDHGQALRLKTKKALDYTIFKKIVTLWRTRVPNRLVGRTLEEKSWIQKLNEIKLQSPKLEGLSEKFSKRQDLILKILKLCERMKAIKKNYQLKKVEIDDIDFDE